MVPELAKGSLLPLVLADSDANRLNTIAPESHYCGSMAISTCPQLLSRGREQFNLAGSFLAPIDGRYKIADARGSAVGYTRIPASCRVDRTYVATFNKACNPQTTEDSDTWLVYGGL
ncbi:hypothetical protein ALC57_01396 [Trachymyrmex cornetzi]|uniref:Uncharacterized protein n=1 Tax=Trachymyrmex cornetzi TaxID=471704 RepID=A0A195EM33_9HYME|nr:hypothetical protein ALC57_01396 [Trachymyrmex cornetzi]